MTVIFFFIRAIADLDFKVYTYRGYGREFMKSCKTSPDVYIQMALQYAYYKLVPKLVPNAKYLGTIQCVPLT